MRGVDDRKTASKRETSAFNVLLFVCLFACEEMGKCSFCVFIYRSVLWLSPTLVSEQEQDKRVGRNDSKIPSLQLYAF